MSESARMEPAASAREPRTAQARATVARPAVAAAAPTRPAWLGLVQLKAVADDEQDPLEREADRLAEAAVVGDADGTAGSADAAVTEEVTDGSDSSEVSVGRAEMVQRSAVPGAPPRAAVSVPTSAGRSLTAAESSFARARLGHGFDGVRVHEGAEADAAARAIGARAFTSGRDVSFRSAVYRAGSPEGRLLLAHELVHVLQQAGAASGTVQRQTADVPVKSGAPDVPEKKHFTVVPDRPMTGPDFQAYICAEIFGVDLATGAVLSKEFTSWTGDLVTSGVTAAAVGRKHPVRLDARIYRRLRGGATPGGAEGRTARSEGFAGLPADARAAITAEIDRRYRARTGTAADPADPGEVWQDTKDEVLAQREALMALPPQVQKALGGAEHFDPARYRQLTRIASRLTTAEWGDYLSRVTAHTTDLAVLDRSITSYLAAKAERDASAKRYSALQGRFAGSENIFDLYRDYQKASEAASGTTWVDPMGGGGWTPPSKAEVEAETLARERLVAALTARGFPGGIPEFEKTKREFVAAFEAEAVNIGVTALDRYESFLFRQAEYYSDDAVIASLYQRLSGYRKAGAEVEKQEAIAESSSRRYNSQKEDARRPGNGGIVADERLAAATEEANRRGKASEDVAKSELAGLVADHPIFSEQHLHPSRRIQKRELLHADQAGVKRMLATHIAARTADVRTTRSKLRSDPEVIYRMDQLCAEAFGKLEVKPGSIFRQMIDERREQIKRDETLIAILVGVLAIAFMIMTFGTGAIVVIGAVGATVVGGASAYAEFEKYRIASAAAGSGMASDDPSPLWLVISVIGVAFDAAGAVAAVRALRPAAIALEAGGELAAFRSSVQLLEKQGLIDAKIARSAEQAATASRAYAGAKAELKAALGKLYSLPGPLVDAEVYSAVAKMAVARVRQGLASVQEFIAELNAMRVEAKLAKLTDSGLNAATRAFREAEESAQAAGKGTTRLPEPPAVPKAAEPPGVPKTAEPPAVPKQVEPASPGAKPGEPAPAQPPAASTPAQLAHDAAIAQREAEIAAIEKELATLKTQRDAAAKVQATDKRELIERARSNKALADAREAQARATANPVRRAQLQQEADEAREAWQAARDAQTANQDAIDAIGLSRAAAEARLKIAMTNLKLAKAGRRLSDSAAVTRRLKSHVDEAVRKFETGEIVPDVGDARAAASGKMDPAVARGNAIDLAAKRAIAADPDLEGLTIVPRGGKGPDIYDSLTKRWWDITTPEQWAAHLKYSADYGEGFSLFTRPPKGTP
jgi:hypothetical protein